MATNVFGNPVTDETVRLIYPNLITITARHRADVAVLYMHQESRMENLNKFVYNLAQANNATSGPTTLGMIYNATGNNLSFSARHTWEGDIVQVYYPDQIRNGQWAGFLHFNRNSSRSSKEGIVYRGQDENGERRYWLLAWTTNFFGLPANRAYTEVNWNEVPPGDRYWNTIDSRLTRVTQNFHEENLLRCFSSVTIGMHGVAELVGVMSLSPVISSVLRAMEADVSTISRSGDSKYEDDDATPTAADDDDATPTAAAE